MARKKNLSESQILLGKNIARLRIAKDVSRMQLARKIKKNQQDIEKYESGEFVPLPVMEDIAVALGEPIQKKIMRRISFLRKLEVEKKTEQMGLCDLYNEAFPEIEYE